MMKRLLLIVVIAVACFMLYGYWLSIPVNLPDDVQLAIRDYFENRSPYNELPGWKYQRATMNRSDVITLHWSVPIDLLDNQFHIAACPDTYFPLYTTRRIIAVSNRGDRVYCN